MSDWMEVLTIDLYAAIGLSVFKVPTNNWQSSLYLSYFNGHANNYNLYKRQATLISDCNKSCSISLNSTVQMHRAKNANPFESWKVTAIGS